MSTKITRDILESHLYCKLKGHLKLTGEEGSKSDYERLLTGRNEDVRIGALDKILSQQPMDQVERGISITPAILKRGAAFILDAVLEDDLFSLHLDGLKRVDEPSKLGAFHYIPLLFCESRRIPKEQKLLLELFGLVLGRLQGRQPNIGLIWQGKDCQAKKLRLNANLRDTERLLDSLRQMHAGKAEPTLILNDHCQVCEFRQRCHLQAKKEDNISLLRGMGPKEIKNYARKGIFTVTQLSHTFRPRRKGKRAEPRTNKRHHALQALAVRDKTIYVFGSPTLPASPVKMFLDIESNPEEGYVYLIGLIVVEDEAEKRFSFWADGPQDERAIFEQFLATVTQYEAFVVYFYGSYEAAFLKRMQKHTDLTSQIDRVLKASINILSVIYAHVYFPTYSNGLKEIGACLGCSWSKPDASGLQSIVWRAKWEASHDDVWKQTLTTYNQEDCAALRTVTAQVYSLIAPPQNNVIKPLGTAEGPHVASVDEIDRLSGRRTWGLVEYVHEDYAFINKCGYFDYQRRRVYVRSIRTRKRHFPRVGIQRNRKLRVTHRVQIVASKCPHCKSTQIVQLANRQLKGIGVRTKRAFDLVITPSGIKRRIIECRSQIHECESCDSKFVPNRYERLAKHYHGLQSWAMYQHIAHGISFGILELMFSEFFGLSISDVEVLVFKGLMARYYQQTYQRMLTKLMSGTLLHVDETEVKLKTGKGYVWVFTNLEEVVFLYRPTREANFLRDLLKNFRGVLVSDFYSAYDSIECPQQKCLIHLIRDMNQELLNNPFDQELLKVTEPFGRLLRAIVTTVDEHGLKRWHLQRHKRNVKDYFQVLSSSSYQSEAAQALRERLTKYQEKLFTFIDYDGVPWNNNNAENAIKRFAYYRAETAGTMREQGLNDYLTLLSLCHTCRYKGISFLKFLLSRGKDIDAFAQGKRRKQRLPSIELYPKGFVYPLGRIGRKAKTNSQPPDVPIERQVEKD